MSNSDDSLRYDITILLTANKESDFEQNRREWNLLSDLSNSYSSLHKESILKSRIYLKMKLLEIMKIGSF